MTLDAQNRRTFLFFGGMALAARWNADAAVVASPRVALPASQQLSSPVPARPDPLPPTLVREFVQKAHADLAGVRTMLAEHPSLLNATWDWGGGDFETALGGASHMGSRETAEYLIERGARVDIFAAAMLGQLEVVRAWLAASPALVASRGPHGISLLRHARAGGAGAAGVTELLLARGAQ